MVLSCLVEPLVSPLIGQGTGGPRQKRSRRLSRLAATALCYSALVVVATNVGASMQLQTASERVVRSAHKKPDPVPLRVILSQHATRDDKRDDVKSRPDEAPDFEQEAVLAHRLKHCRNIVGVTGPRVGQTDRWQRLLEARKESYLYFGSGQHRSGAATPLII